MADYDSDSSGAGDDIETNVLLGYVSKEPTSDEFSQVGGRPTWLDGKTPPPGSLQSCKVCNEGMSLLLQLNANLPGRFPAHERRLYVLGCRRKPCRRKTGSVRAFRAIRTSSVKEAHGSSTAAPVATAPAVPPANLGNSLFGVKSSSSSSANPFSSTSNSSGSANPFSSAKPASEEPSTSASATTVSNLHETFAQKVQISADGNEAVPNSISAPVVPWIDDSTPYPSYYLDADKEYLYPETQDEPMPSNARIDNESESSSAADERALFESTMDKTFQRFADRLSQNPEQVLRYEFAGQPLLYTKMDAVGKLLAPAIETKVHTTTSQNGATGGLKVPRCTSCGAARVFEMQLTPHAITELEAEEMSIDGMDWGTIIVGACGEDCQEKGRAKGEVGYVEEWVGVQWEEIADHRKR